MLLQNERYLDVTEEIAGSVAKDEIWSFFKIDADDTQSVRQEVIERARFHSIKTNTSWQ